MKTFDQIYSESATTATLAVGFTGTSGKVVVEKAEHAAESIVLDAATSTASLGGDKAGDGIINLWNSSGKNTVTVNGSVKVDIKKIPSLPQGIQRDLGGQIVVCNSEGTPTSTLNGLGTLVLGEEKTIVLDGGTGDLTLGGGGNDGDVILQDSDGIRTIFLHAANGNMTLGTDNRMTILLDGERGDLTLGGTGINGDIVMKNSSDSETIKLDAANGELTLGGTGINGDIVMKNSSDSETIKLDAANGVLTLGGTGVNGDVVIKNNQDTETIKITGSTGDIELLNADVAEEFEIQPDCLAEVSPGTVVVVDESGRLRPCDEAYDGRVVGIVAGAGQYRPGIVLDRKGGRNRLPVAMVGKVYCWVEADSEPVRVGDLLTTSGMKGHAKRASNRLEAFGSVIGKALQTLTQGRALIPVLVKPQ